MSDIYSAGSQLVTADAIVGSSGVPIRIFSMNILSGGTAGVVILRNGTTVSSTIYAQATAAVISAGNQVNFGEKGLFFPAGCFCDIDANVTSCLVTYAQ